MKKSRKDRQSNGFRLFIPELIEWWNHWAFSVITLRWKWDFNRLLSRSREDQQRRLPALPETSASLVDNEGYLYVMYFSVRSYRRQRKVFLDSEKQLLLYCTLYWFTWRSTVLLITATRSSCADLNTKEAPPTHCEWSV